MTETADIDLTGRRVLAVVTNYGVEQDELVVPVEELRGAGAVVDVAAVSAEEIETLVGDKDPGERVEPTTTLADVEAVGYDLLLVPGGTINADALRLEEDAVQILRDVVSAGKPVAAICHGPWLVVEADLARGKTLTSYPSVATDIRNAGGEWIDSSAVSDDSDGWTLITSRTPDDLEDFVREIVTVLGDG